MSRSKWKLPIIDTSYTKKNKLINRNSTIVRKFIGLTFQTHNGKIYKEITITENMVGHKFGEFLFTRCKFIFKKKKSKK